MNCRQKDSISPRKKRAQLSPATHRKQIGYMAKEWDKR